MPRPRRRAGEAAARLPPRELRHPLGALRLLFRDLRWLRGFLTGIATADGAVAGGVAGVVPPVARDGGLALVAGARADSARAWLGEPPRPEAPPPAPGAGATGGRLLLIVVAASVLAA